MLRPLRSISITLQCLGMLLTIVKKSKGGRGCCIIMIVFNLPRQLSEKVSTIAILAKFQRLHPFNWHNLTFYVVLVK